MKHFSLPKVALQTCSYKTPIILQLNLLGKYSTLQIFEFNRLSSVETSISPCQTIAEASSTFYGLPKIVKELLKSLRGIGDLYEWQDELLVFMVKCRENALRLAALGHLGKELFTNLLYLSPTSEGKTLIAEILMFICLLLQKLNYIFVMPLLSIVQEKVSVYSLLNSVFWAQSKSLPLLLTCQVKSIIISE